MATNKIFSRLLIGSFILVSLLLVSLEVISFREINVLSSPLDMYHFFTEFLAPVVSYSWTGAVGFDVC